MPTRRLASPHRPKISRQRWARVALFAMDVDGILTDGRVIIDSVGGEAKAFSVLDGMGIGRMVRSGIPVAWISGRLSKATTLRAQELKVPHLIQGRTDKLAALQTLAAELKIDAEHCVYMGDDDIDAAALSWAGIGVSVPAAVPKALAAADYVTTREAGFGAVREICEHILTAKGLSFTP